MILGIDPGCSGALVILDDKGNFIDAMRTPTLKDGKQTKVNGAAIVRFLECHQVKHAYIEKVHSMPKQGVSSTFTFGHSAGVVEGIIQGMNIPYTMITPQSWKKTNNLVGTDKDAARSRAIQLYPGLKSLDKKGEGQAVADALLIARHGANIQE